MNSSPPQVPDLDMVASVVKIPTMIRVTLVSGHALIERACPVVC